MRFKKSPSTLTKREMEIMSILWESDKPLVASEIAKKGENLTINTVQALLKKLMNQKYIKVADIVYSGTVLSRCYTPVISSDEYEMNNMMTAYGKLSNKAKGMSSFVTAFLAEDENPDQLLAEIDELQAMLLEKKAALKKGNTKE